MQKPYQLFHDLRWEPSLPVKNTKEGFPAKDCEFAVNEAIRVRLNGRYFDARYVGSVDPDSMGGFSSDVAKVRLLNTAQAQDFQIAGEEIVIHRQKILPKQSAFELMTISAYQDYYRSILNIKRRYTDVDHNAQRLWMKSVPSSAMSSMRESVVVHEFYNRGLHRNTKLLCFGSNQGGLYILVPESEGSNVLRNFDKFRCLTGYELEDKVTKRLAQYSRKSSSTFEDLFNSYRTEKFKEGMQVINTCLNSCVGSSAQIVLDFLVLSRNDLWYMKKYDVGRRFRQAWLRTLKGGTIQERETLLRWIAEVLCGYSNVDQILNGHWGFPSNILKTNFDGSRTFFGYLTLKISRGHREIRRFSVHLSPDSVGCCCELVRTLTTFLPEECEGESV